MTNIYLMDLSKTLSKWEEQLEAILGKYAGNPIFWTLLCIVLFALAAWAIGYFNNK